MTRRCRFCKVELAAEQGADVVLDLGAIPLANDLHADHSSAVHAERYPLCMVKCGACGLHQLTIAVDGAKLFSEYAYATPDMPSLSQHYERVHRFLSEYPYAKILEIGGNNGAFLRTFRGLHHVKVNVDPAQNIHSDVGDCDIGLSIPAFFDAAIARKLVEDFGKFDQVIARHCFAHIDDLDAVLEGVKTLLDPDTGVFYIENAYVVDTMVGGQFDQIYHEHVSYLSIDPVRKFLKRHGMRLIDVDYAEIHGGSLMLVACLDSAVYDDDDVYRCVSGERIDLFQGLEAKFVKQAWETIHGLASMLTELAEQGKTVDLYGATAKSTTLMNAVVLEARRVSVRRCYDRAPLKIGKFLPGTGVWIVSEGWMHDSPPDYCLITAWNYADEIMEREQWFTEQGGKWIVPLPRPRVIG